eukprot:s2900_g4.t1
MVAAWSGATAKIKDGQGKVLRCIELETKRPDFLADADGIPHATRHLQGSDPTRWAMTNFQLLLFFNYVRPTLEYEAAKHARGHVCLYDINSLFVIPWSSGCGCGVALLMNVQSPLKAQVMISHAWAEDIEQLVGSLSSWAARIQSIWACSGVPLWCCAFAQYQPEDGAGPSLQQQLSLDPFKSVIQSRPVHGMLVVHTTKADPYDRLWCVHEIDEALDSKLFVTAIGTYSVGGRNVCTRSAKCGHPADEERIRAVIERKSGGYERLDSAIKAFRSTLLKSGASVIAEIEVPWKNYRPFRQRHTYGFLVDLEDLGLDKLRCGLKEFGMEENVLFDLLTLTDNDGSKVQFGREQILDFSLLAMLCQGKFLAPARFHIHIDQPVVARQFPLKLACALDVHHRRHQLSEIESQVRRFSVFTGKAIDIDFGVLKLQHPVLSGQWIAGNLSEEAKARLCKEIPRILAEATEFAGLLRFDFSNRDLSHWSVYLRGTTGTPYDSGWFAAEFDIPVNYPLRPPKNFRILTKILHPNVDMNTGEVCLDILFRKHSPAFIICKLILSVVALLGKPEPDDPMNVEAAALQLSHPKIFAEKARLWTQMYALREPPSFRALGIGTKCSV